jgi:hypothetical protein
MIHTTIGIYLDGSYKVNGVQDQDLNSHIEYNKTFRFGRALIVDGKIVHLGYFKLEALQKIIQENNFTDLQMNSCTVPYR